MSLTAKDWLGTDNILGIDIWNNKYRYNGETFKEWLDRISNNNEQYRQLIIEKKFLPAGRILANRGLYKIGKKITYSNCYVSTPPEDNLESIFEVAKNIARTYSYGGGIGIDISKLRPNKAKVNNAAKKSSGAISFMDLYSMVTGLISQSGRRGALMISINCNHPDIEEFIDIKKDLNRVTKANISIKVTDEFMKAVRNNSNYKLEFVVQPTGEVITKTVKAKDLFYKICKSNWDMGEPAMLFWDNINKWNLLSEDKNFTYAGTNPCFTGDMLLLTDDGYQTFKSLNDTQFNIVDINGDVSKGKVWCSGDKKVVELTLSNNSIIRCTPDHRFMTINGDECIAKDTKNKKLMPYIKNKYSHDEKYIKLGFIQGDGQLSRLESKYHQGIEVNIGIKDGDIADLFSNEQFEKKSDRAIYLYNYLTLLDELEFSHNTLPTREFPNSYNNWTIEQKASFINGCYSANGSIITNYRISYKTTCFNFAKQLVETLDKDFGIKSYITTNKKHSVEFSNGEYECKESYDINIGKFEDIAKFNLHIGFYQQYKKIQLAQLIIHKTPYVRRITELGIEKVYDFTENNTHWGVVNGVIAHNCAEEPLPAGGSCLLGSINLSEFIADNKFQFNNFENVVRLSVRYLNEVLIEGINLHPLKEQKESVNNWRQIGLGIMGLADMLIKLKLKYGDEESIKLCDEIGFIMANTSIQESALMAKEFEKYPMYSDLVLQSPYYKSNTTNYTKSKVKEHGLTNSQLLTCAPTGTLSTMLGISGGIEPIYDYSYNRKTESLHEKEKTYKVYTPIVDKYLKDNNLKSEKDLPPYFTNAKLLDYKDRIKMQGVWQKHIDASISSTVNLHENVTVEDIENIYMLAWENNLKGITVFRDKCKRIGILTTDDDNNQNEVKLQRGDIIQVNDDVIGKKRKLMTGCGSLHCSAWFDPITGELLETFLSKGSSGGCLNSITGLSRMISIAARSGCNIYSIIDQLNSCGTCASYAVRTATKKDTSKGACCPIAVGNALLDMYKEVRDELGLDDHEETAVKIDNKLLCPECGEEIIPENGCMSCRSCGWSKCS